MSWKSEKHEQQPKKKVCCSLLQQLASFFNHCLFFGTEGCLFVRVRTAMPINIYASVGEVARAFICRCE